MVYSGRKNSIMVFPSKLIFVWNMAEWEYYCRNDYCIKSYKYCRTFVRVVVFVCRFISDWFPRAHTVLVCIFLKYVFYALVRLL